MGEEYSVQKKINWTNYQSISDSIKRAVIAAEDDRFLEHHGVDFKAIQEAIKNNLENDVKRGGSTISQQLVKNLFLNPSKNILRKLHEFVLVFFLEAFLTKERILELYLNIAEWGFGIYGIKDAANYYFNVDPGHLESYQSAKLAAMLTNPKKYQHNINSEFLNKKTKQIFSRMDYSRIP
jgi:monofunctional biosynthetic peptidoglycan transglycosylase